MKKLKYGLSLTFFAENKKENILFLVGEIVFGALLIWAFIATKNDILSLFFLSILKWYVLLISIILGVAGFFYDTGSPVLQRILKICFFPAFFVAVIMALLLVFVFANSKGTSSSSSSSSSSSGSLGQALSAYSKAVQDKQRYAKDLERNPSDQYARKQMHAAEKNMYYALADMIRIKSGDVSAATSFKLAADSIHSARTYGTNDAYKISDQYMKMADALGKAFHGAPYDSIALSFRHGASEYASGISLSNVGRRSDGLAEMKRSIDSFIQAL